MVLGNPPWDQIQLDDREFFAVTAPEIAGAANMTARKRMISELAKSDPFLHDAYLQAVRANDGVKHFAHASGRFPFTSFGRLNTAPLFCELGLHVINSKGYSGLIVPTGIATDSFNQHFFNRIVDTRALSSLYDFENRAGLFPDVDSRMKFCLLILNGSAKAAKEMRFAFFAHDVSDLAEITFSLTPEDIALLNPNTRTTPIFRTKRDADLTKSIYQRVPILIREGESEENPWGIKFQLMFMMNTDSDKFRTRDELEAAGYTLVGNWFVKPPSPTLPPQGEGSLAYAEKSPHLRGGDLEGGQSRYLPLYEAKMMHQFTHRWATYTTSPLHLGEGPGVRVSSRPEAEGPGVRDFTSAELRDPSALPMPRYWVDAREVQAKLDFWDRGWMLGFRDIARPTDERTAIFDVIPRVGVGNKVPVWLSDLDNIALYSCLFANTTAFTFDFVARQKIGGASLNFFYVKQFPVIPPHTYTPALLNFIVPRVLELTYTAWDLQPFAQDLGYHGPPFIWDEERRFLMRCELDALYFHLYQIPRDDVDYIMETFPIVRRKDIAATADGTHPLAPGPSGRGADQVPPPEGEGFRVGAEGEYLTKRIILEMYDQMAALPTIPVPAPKSSPRPAGEAPRRVGEEPGVRASSPTSSSGGGENTSVSKSPHLRGGDLEGGPGEGTYLVPDVSQWQTWLNPPPADPSVAHGEDRE